MQEPAEIPSELLLGPAEIRQLAGVLDVSPTKKLGQNFVHDPNTVRKIVRLAGVTAADRVIEVGPGLGSLTLGLTATGAAVTAVEIDPRLAAQLPETTRMKQQGAHLAVLHRDALEVTAAEITAAAGAESTPNVLVANLPYNVSVPILMHLLEILPALSRGLVMVQAEVGQRIAAQPGVKIYGAPSAKAAWYGEWRIAGTVSRQIFWPVPGVDSVLVSFCRYREELGSEAERDATFQLVQAAFEQRRKMLRGSLQAILGGAERTARVLGAAGVAETARAENLSIHDFLRIARIAEREK